MTLSELQNKREEVLRSLGIARLSFGERSIEYARQKEALDLIDNEIAKLSQTDQTRTFVIQSSRGLD